ncbi:unnamed protein product [Larinioides sclopetarius]|uniref:Uncharacterized protein n=1 Tax=Larinioides sclopetarius TaxID=280406 RepID=A0AAV1Z8L4_9ARAC
MARLIKIGKSFSFESSSLKTPTFKEISPAPCSYDSTKDETPHQPILMDEFGQTPDHFYLARKPPPSFFQVKRKLDLHSVGPSKVESTRPTRTRQKKKPVIIEKPRDEHDISIRNPMEVYNPMCPGSVWSHGDTVIKNAFITEEDDIAPMGKNFLMQTEDQDLDLPLFPLLETPMDNYSFSLDDGEGITDLFDCGFSCP